MHDDPLRAQSLALVAGAILAAIAVAGCAVLGFVKPQGLLGAAQIVVVRESGALYVRIDDTWHLAPNLASARLVARSPADPVVVGERALAGVKRGPAVGISGAPSSIGAPAAWQSWSVCDGPDTTVFVDERLDRLDRTRSVLVTPRGESASSTYLLYDGVRAQVDLRNAAVRRALRLDGIAPVPVSRALLDSVPEVAAIAVPLIVGSGGTGPPSLGGIAIGAVVRVARSDADDYYVTLADGVQPIGEVAADLIRFAYAGSAAAVPTVAPATIADTRVVDRLALDDLPRRARTPVGSDSAPVVCAQWRAGPAEVRSHTVVLVGGAAEYRHGFVLAQADGDGPNIDRVVMPPGRAGFVRSARIVGDDGSSGPQYLLTDSGVAYAVRDREAASALGLTGPAQAAPWSILARLPQGPELSIDGASVVYDSLAASP